MPIADPSSPFLGTSNTIFLLSESALVRDASFLSLLSSVPFSAVSTTTALALPLLRFAFLKSLSLCLSAASAARSSAASTIPGSPHSASNSSLNFFLASMESISLLFSCLLLSLSAALVSISSAASSIPGSAVFSRLLFFCFSETASARAASSSSLIILFSRAFASASCFLLSLSALISSIRAAFSASLSFSRLSEEAFFSSFTFFSSFSAKGRLSGIGSTSRMSVSYPSSLAIRAFSSSYLGTYAFDKALLRSR